MQVHGEELSVMGELWGGSGCWDGCRDTGWLCQVALSMKVTMCQARAMSVLEWAQGHRDAQSHQDVQNEQSH